MTNSVTYRRANRLTLALGVFWVAFFSLTVLFAEVAKSSSSIQLINLEILDFGSEEEKPDERDQDRNGEEELEPDQFKEFANYTGQLADFYQSDLTYYLFNFSELHPECPKPPPDFLSFL